jgi:hypothetical protein
VHMNQVHKETLSHVENAIPGRQALDVEIFGMEGVPQEIIDQHNQQVTHKHFEEEQERARVTGNPIRGMYSNGTAPPTKKAKVKEEITDLAARAAQFRVDKANGVLPVAPIELPPQPVCVLTCAVIHKLALLRLTRKSLHQLLASLTVYQRVRLPQYRLLSYQVRNSFHLQAHLHSLLAKDSP